MTRTACRYAGGAFFAFVIVFLAGCGSDDGGPVDVVDTTPPSRINLGERASSSSTVTLAWVASGDDASSGTASEYDLRYATNDSASWDQMTSVPDLPRPQPAGSEEHFVVEGLDPETEYSFVLRVADEVPNWSVLSERLSLTTACVGDEHWSTMGGHVGDAFALSVWNGQYVVGGDRIPLRRWTGSAWEVLAQVPSQQAIRCMTTYNNLLIVAGYFTSIGGVAANNIAAFDGTAWHALGSGLTWELGADNQTVVHALLVQDGDLIAGGENISHAGGIRLQNLARWDGSAWHAVGSTVSVMPSVRAIVEHDGQLVVGTNAAGTGNGVLRWDGTNWSPVGTRNGVKDLVVHQGSLVATGGTGTDAVARWDGVTWVGFPGQSWEHAAHLVVFDDELVASVLGADCSNAIVRWNGTAWSRMGCGGASHCGPRLLAADSDRLLLERGGHVLAWSD